MERLRIALNAQLDRLGQHGGLEHALIGLVRALGELEGPEEYAIACSREQPDWLAPYLGPNQRVVVPPRARRRFRARLRMLGHRRPPADLTAVRTSPGFLESLDCDLVHFPYQHFEICALPSVFSPHDLQHLHYPKFFSPEEIARREAVYRKGCELAQAVVVGSSWVKQDIVGNYGTDASKVQVIPWAPVEACPRPSDDTVKSVQDRYGLQPGFALYPAVTWPHKNHLRLLEAIALLRDRHGVDITLVCTGFQTDFYQTIHQAIRTLRLEDRVRFLGRIPCDHLRSLYRLAGLTVVPTLFEAASGPVFEAWLEDVPVACSIATSLPEQVQDAGILFDPASTVAVADAMLKLHRDRSLREQLIRKGRSRLHDFSWDKTARAHRAVYRKVAGTRLSDEDTMLLASDWTKESRNNS